MSQGCCRLQLQFSCQNNGRDGQRQTEAVGPTETKGGERGEGLTLVAALIGIRADPQQSQRSKRAALQRREMSRLEQNGRIFSLTSCFDSFQIRACSRETSSAAMKGKYID